MATKKSKKTPNTPYIDIKKLNANPEELADLYASLDADGPQSFYKLIDRFYQANLAKLTKGISPAGVRSSFTAWLLQLMQSPGRMLELYLYFPLHFHILLHKIISNAPVAEGKDVRFKSEKWQYLPWRLNAETFFMLEQWWSLATDIAGVPIQAQRVVKFCTRQLLDANSPANFILTNPELLDETIKTYGMNVVRGVELGMTDLWEHITGTPPAGSENFIPGKQVAVTPGRVIFRNRLIELIQYEAQTKTVYKEPILILPAWIMKYYILDLSPHNSLVKWLVSQGHTVYIVSWLNPKSKDRNLGMDDYYRLGAMAAIDMVSQMQPKTKIHLMGYCLGGTLSIITAAAMANNNDKRLKTLTLLAAQGDFTEAGELLLFTNKSEVSFLENMMWEQGYLDTKQMAGAFQMLRSYDLIWSKMIQDYMHGERRGMIDLFAWNADATRMPYKMHSEYLEKLFLNNDLAAGRYRVEGKNIVAEDISVPAFVVSTEKDHVAPWKSVYKIHLMLNHDLTFVLVQGGHNAGIISEPGNPKAGYKLKQRKRASSFLSPETWYEKAEHHDGSWWTAWQQWLVANSDTKQITPPKLDPDLPKAPGTYVFQK
ncbi:MAG: PHA/PHB synthase family protein [Gammaproteobacteria bacterium]